MSAPTIARTDTKRKLVSNVVESMTEEGLEDVLDSICGDEFQSTAAGILKALEERKKAKLRCPA
jgi:hypothetical protein